MCFWRLFITFFLFCHCYDRLPTFTHNMVNKHWKLKSRKNIHSHWSCSFISSTQSNLVQSFSTSRRNTFFILLYYSIYFLFSLHALLPLTCTQNPQELSSTRSAKITAQWAALLPLMDKGGSYILNYRFVYTFGIN